MPELPNQKKLKPLGLKYKYWQYDNGYRVAALSKRHINCLINNLTNVEIDRTTLTFLKLLLSLTVGEYQTKIWFHKKNCMKIEMHKICNVLHTYVL